MGTKVQVDADIPQTVNYVAATVAVGSTTTLEPGAEATVSNSGTEYNAVFDFGIPRGKNVYEQAVEGGYTGSEEEFNAMLAEDLPVVATNISDITTTANNISDVHTVADNVSDVNTVATNVADVNTVAGISTDVTGVASISSDVSTVAAHNSDVTLVSDNMANVTTTATSITDVQTVAGIASDVSTVAGIASDVSAVEDIKTDVSAVAANATNINAVNANKTNIDTVAGNNTNITTVATNISNVNTAVTNMAAIIAAPTAAANAATSEANAQTWAEGTDVAVAALGGTKSSKGWADRAKELVDSIGTVLHYKGSVATYADLPSTGNVIGDVWNVLDDGSNYAWDGTGWDKLSGTVDLSAYRTAAAQDLIDAGKQATLVSGTNIKTINSTSLLGSGNISVWDNTNLVGSDTILISQAPGPIIDANTLAVWHFDDGLTDVISELTIGGKQTTDYHKFGPGAGYEVGLYDSGFTEWRTSVSGLDCTTDDFTVDGWVYYNGSGGQRVYFGPGGKVGYYFNGTGIGLYGSDDVVRAYVNKTSSDYYGNADYQLTTYGWHHLAIQQDVTAQKIQFFCDGNMFYEYSGLCNTYDWGVANKAVNAVANPESVWYDEVRVSNVVRYPSTGFTPFTEAYGNGSAPYEIKAADTLATTAQLETKQDTLVSGTNIKTVNGNSLLGSGNVDINGLPSQAGQSGKFLTTDGTDASWANVDALPSQTGQSGKFLTTDGSAASWATIPPGVSADGTTIEDNSNVFTTVGVKDQKTSNANKMWTGTKAEYDAIVSKDANTFYHITDDEPNTVAYAKADLSNLTHGLENTICTTPATTTSTATSAKPAVVVENYVNGTSWYRVYSDGWCEQGGKASSTTVTLLKAYQDIDYNLQMTYKVNSSQIYGQDHPYTKTASGFTCGNEFINGFWLACGYIA